jgi:hypothetical protein
MEVRGVLVLSYRGYNFTGYLFWKRREAWA